MNPTNSCQINKVEITNDTLTSRAGLIPFVKYLSAVGIVELLLRKFDRIKKNAKGTPAGNLFKQILCFFFEGTSRHLNYFDELARDKGYAAGLENQPEQMASSHVIKRFLKAFGPWTGKAFRWVLGELWIWRIKLQAPSEIILTIDTMVMDNDEARRREGCDPTYKKKKGFQPLHLIWEGKIVDAIFRRGKKHSNYGKEAAKLLEKNATLIRERYSWDVLIIVRLDSGFLDEHTFKVLEELGLGFIATGRMSEAVKEKVAKIPRGQWRSYDNGKQLWDYASLRYGCEKWEEDYRAFYTKLALEGEQQILEFARPDNIIMTNLEEGSMVWDMMSEEQRQRWSQDEMIIQAHHQRGADELPHRGLKDFGSEQLPFKGFAPNRAYYYLMVVGFFLFETFKEDNFEGSLAGSLSAKSYASTVRRKLIDLAGKIVSSGREVILKISQAAMERLALDELLDRCCQAPLISTS